MAGFHKYNLLGMCRADSFAIHATTEVTAIRASHVRQCLRTAIRASYSLHGRRFPISATRMRVSARGLVFWQCHNFSSISFNRLSLSVLYITASAVQIAQPNFSLVRQKLYKRAQFMPLSSSKTTETLHLVLMPLFILLKLSFQIL